MFTVARPVPLEPDHRRVSAVDLPAGRTARADLPAGRNRMSQVRRRLRVLQVERAMPGRGLAA